jgi:hypothetical protein
MMRQDIIDAKIEQWMTGSQIDSSGCTPEEWAAIERRIDKLKEKTPRMSAQLQPGMRQDLIDATIERWKNGDGGINSSGFTKDEWDCIQFMIQQIMNERSGRKPENRIFRPGMKTFLKVELNGTNENPYNVFGLTQNPFPQIAKMEYMHHCLNLQKLGGEPIPNVEYIREVLKGWSEEFIELCCSRFKPGEYVEFIVKLPEPL